jgi:hypothetical protein
MSLPAQRLLFLHIGRTLTSHTVIATQTIRYDFHVQSRSWFKILLFMIHINNPVSRYPKPLVREDMAFMRLSEPYN